MNAKRAGIPPRLSPKVNAFERLKPPPDLRINEDFLRFRLAYPGTWQRHESLSSVQRDFDDLYKRDVPKYYKELQAYNEIKRLLDAHKKKGIGHKLKKMCL